LLDVYFAVTDAPFYEKTPIVLLIISTVTRAEVNRAGGEARYLGLGGSLMGKQSCLPWGIQTVLFIESFFSIIRYSGGKIPV
jgi:hypothetical protein